MMRTQLSADMFYLFTFIAADVLILQLSWLFAQFMEHSTRTAAIVSSVYLPKKSHMG